MPARFRYLGLARTKDDLEYVKSEQMAISCTKFDFLSGLTELGRRRGLEINGYAEFNTDSWVIRGREPSGNWTQMRISRYEVEDNKHIAKLQDFMEMLMCGSKGSTPVTTPQQLAEIAKYQQLAQQQSSPADWNGYGQDLSAIMRSAMGDNQYKGELGPIPEKVVPEIKARELTKEELKERVARKLDLAEAKAIDPVESLSVGRWRQVMDEVFKEEPKGDDHGGEKEEDGTVSNGRGHGRKDGG